jgi:chromate transporter
MHATDSDAPFDEPARPSSLLDLFLSFQAMALQGFGGVLTVVQRVLCEEKRWLTQTEFAELWAVSQVLPGPNVVNLGIILGDRYFGFRGAVVALAGLFTAPLFLVSTLAVLYSQFANLAVVAGAVKGMGAVAAGMIGAVGLKLLPTVRSNPIGVPVFTVTALVTFSMVALLRLPLVWAILGVGIPAVLWTYHQLSQLQKRGAK